MKNTTIRDEQLVYRLQHDAAIMLKENTLFLNGITIIPKEIEIYYYENGVFEDGSVHQNELQLLRRLKEGVLLFSQETLSYL